MVPALDLPVDKLGEMLKNLGADSQVTGSVTQVFGVLRDLSAKAEAQAKASAGQAAAASNPGGASQGPAGAAERPAAPPPAADPTRAVPMDTDDIKELREFLQTATGQAAPAEDLEVREAVKRMATAAELLAKRRRTAAT